MKGVSLIWASEADHTLIEITIDVTRSHDITRTKVACGANEA